MNILIDSLPNSIEVKGKSVKIRTDFRDCLRVLMACEDNQLTPQEKQLIILTNIYPKIPKDIDAAMESALWFLDGGKEDITSETDGNNKRLFSWNKDANIIYAAFRQSHGIDLTSAKLHWWQFLALFMDLGQDTAFCQLTALRSRIKSGKATKEERELASSMGDSFIIEDIDSRSIEEKEAYSTFMKLIGAKK